MLEMVTYQPFSRYGIAIWKKRSTKQYTAYEKKVTSSGIGFSKEIAKSALFETVRTEVENYIINKRLVPSKIDEEDIL